MLADSILLKNRTESQLNVYYTEMAGNECGEADFRLGGVVNGIGQ